MIFQSVSFLFVCLFDCPQQNSDFRDIRNKYFVASTMKDVFEQVNMRNIINFIKETHFYNLL